MSKLPKLSKLPGLRSIKNYKHFNKASAGVGVVLFAIVGTILLFRSHAATPFASLEPEQGTRATNAIVVTDSTASGGTAVKFSPKVTLPPPGGGCPIFPEFPNKTCTGVPAGTTLTDYCGDVYGDNRVIENVRLTCPIYVHGNNTTFKNCLINIGPIAIGVDAGKNGLTLENCTVIGGSFIPPFSDFTLRRVLIDGGQRVDGLVIGYSGIGHNGQNVLIEDSYIGPQWGDGTNGGTQDKDHTDALQMWGFGTVSNVVLRHNYINSTNTNPDPTATGVGPCIFLVDVESYENVTIEKNFCDRVPSTKDYFQIRIANDGKTSSGHIIRNNRFSRTSGPIELTSFYPAIWEDNRFIDNGELITQPTVRPCLSRVSSTGC